MSQRQEDERWQWRMAWSTVNDPALRGLHGRIRAALGFDRLGREPLLRWTGTPLAVRRGRLFAGGETG